MNIMTKTCYIINFWLGDRRREPQIYKSDKLIFLKKQIDNLSQVENSIDTVYFNFNLIKDHYHLINEALKIIPKNINKTKVIVNIRENFDFSYGAWSDIVEKEIDNFDYFIFNEDDYIFNIEKWDTYLVNKFKNNLNCGYLGMAVREINDQFKKIMGYETYPLVKESFHSVGITSSENLKKIIDKKGSLIERKNINKYEHETIEDAIEITQSKWSCQFYEIGLENYDVRNEYAVEFQLTDRIENIWRLFWNNDEVIIKSLFTILEDSYTWYSSYDHDYN